MKIFAETTLDDFLKINEEKIKSKIEDESDDYILNVNSKTYAEYLTDEYAIEPINLDFANISVSEREVDIPGSMLSSMTFANPNKTYKKQEVTFHIPYSGKNSEQLFRCRPNAYLMWSLDVFTEDQCVCFGIYI